MDRTPQTKRWDRLSPEARRKAEINSERATFGQDSGAMAEALARAITGQGNASTKQNEAHHGNPAALCRKAMRAGRR